MMLIGELVIAYLLVLYIPRKNIGWILSGYALFAIIFLHIERMINDYGGYHLGIATSFMVQCTHLCSSGLICVTGIPDAFLIPEVAQPVANIKTARIPATCKPKFLLIMNIIKSLRGEATYNVAIVKLFLKKLCLFFVTQTQSSLSALFHPNRASARRSRMKCP